MSDAKPFAELDRIWVLLSHPVPRVTHAAAGRVYGHVQVSPQLVPLSQRVRLGWFLTSAGSTDKDVRLAEGRTELMATEAADVFAFTLDAAALAERHEAPLATLWIDLVHEGEFWFCERAPGAFRIDLALPRPLLGSALGTSMLQRLLAPGGKLALLRAIGAAEVRHGIGKMLRGRLLDSEALLPASAPPRRAMAEGRSGGDSLELGASLVLPPPASALPRQMAAALAAQEPWPPGGTTDTDYFQRTRLEHRHTGLPLTAAMLDAMALTAPETLAQAMQTPETLRQWWLFDVVLPHPLPAEALPHDHRRHWLAPVVADAIAPANRFLTEAWDRSRSGLFGQPGAYTGGTLRDPAERLAFQLGHILESWRDHRRIMLLGEDAIEFWAQKITVGDRLVSLFVLLGAMAMESAAPQVSSAASGHGALLLQCEAVIKLVAEQCPTLLPLLGMQPNRRPAVQAYPVYLVGHRGLPGFAGALRMGAEALDRIGIAARIFDADEAQPLNLTTSGRLLPWDSGMDGRSRAGRGNTSPLSMFFCYADTMKTLVRNQAFTGITARPRIGVFPWGFADLPPAQAAGANEVDAIWAPSDFVHQAFIRITNRPVMTIGLALNLPEAVPDPYPELLPNRRDTFVFYTSFNPAAGLRRKNPSAAVSGFLQAFPRGHEPVALVLRMPESDLEEELDPFGEWMLIEHAAAQDPRIILLNERTNIDRGLGFVRHADAVVSAHRSEAFGQLCAQAHFYARPLIATGFSGNMDYCTPDNTWLLDYKLRDLQPGEHTVDVRTQWADVKVDHVAAQMLAVLHNSEQAGQKALRGRDAVTARYATESFDARLVEQLARW